MRATRRWPGRAPWIALVRWQGVLAVALVGCGPKVATHVVAPGDTLALIGASYGVDYRELARRNGIRDPDHIAVGQRLIVPRRGRRLAARRPGPEPGPSAASAPAFRWPVSEGTVTSGFGVRGRAHHDGVDIAAPDGLAVTAAAAGRVLYSGRLRGYGKLVIVEHEGGFATVYAHNADNLVRAGAAVRAGQRIATIGQTGQASGPHLHFEIRRDNAPRDPLRYLPAPAAAGVQWSRR